MRYLYAKNPKQLDICLRLLYAEHTNFRVEVQETIKQKIVYVIYVETTGDKMASIEEKYRILIS